MKSEEFVIWLKGFVSASNKYNLTPAGWDTLKEELYKVDDRHKGVFINPDIPFNPPYVSDEQELIAPWEEPSENLIVAANRYKDIIDEYDDQGKRIIRKENRPNWYSTSTTDQLKN